MEKTEVWKQIIIDGEAWQYEVSDSGLVRNIKTGKVLKRRLDKGGYLIVNLSKDGKHKKFKVHRLVALMFIPNPEGYSDINHKNEIKTDNRVENLEWMSHKDNVNYGTRNKRSGETRSKKVMGYSLTDTKVIVFHSMSQAQKFGFNSSHISECCNGNRKSHHGYKWKYINNKEQK